MSLKNIRLPNYAPRASSDPIILFSLRILFVFAVIQMLAAGFILLPEWINGLASHLAKRAKIQETGLPIRVPMPSSKLIKTQHEETDVDNISSLQSEREGKRLGSSLSCEEATMEKEIIAKNITADCKNGVQTGDSLSIISIERTPGVEGEQVLKIAIKAQSHEVIAVRAVKVQVYFYDQIEGAISASKSPITSRWLNAVTDWKNGDPQLLEVIYQPNINNPDAKYFGYVVAVYYQGTLQSYRAEPPSITNEFPIKVYTGGDEL